MRILINPGEGFPLTLTGIIPALQQLYPECEIDFLSADPLLEQRLDLKLVSKPNPPYDVELPNTDQSSFAWLPPTYYPTSEEIGVAPACDFCVIGLPQDVVWLMEALYTVIQVGPGQTVAKIRPRVSAREEAAIIFKSRVVVAAESNYTVLSAAMNKKMLVICDELTSYIGTNASTMSPSSAASVVFHKARRML